MKYCKFLLVLTSIYLFTSGVIKGQSLSWKNLYVEAGISNNTLSVTITNIDCPCTQYYSDIKPYFEGGIGYTYVLGSRIAIEPFIGYQNLGTPSTKGEFRNVYSVKAITGSLRGIYRGKNMEFGTYIAYNRHLQVKQIVYEHKNGGWKQLRTWDKFHSIILKNYSLSGGIILRYNIIENFSLAVDTGLSLTNLFKRHNVSVFTPTEFIKNYHMGIDVVYRF